MDCKNWQGVALLGGILVSMAGAAPGDRGPETGRPFPAVKLPAHARGPAVIEALGERLPAVARWYGFTAEDFRAHVGHDHSVHADERGQLYHVCAGVVAGAAVEDAPGPAAVTPREADAFRLHSRPGARLKIFLDFDGHTTRGTSWNASYAGGGDIYTPPFDLDGNPGSFSASERSRIIAIWERVVEDFAAWEVDVTTEDPGVSALVRSGSGDLDYGIRVCIGGDSSWLGAAAGGVAYLGSFNWNSDTPCYVFEANLGNGNEKYTAEAISHEVGHAFSLFHDGTMSGVAYYQGHGNWAPIMGVSYYKEVTQWSRGDYANANNLQDDIAAISTYLPLLPDAAGDFIGGAAELGLVGVTGVIETADDLDLYRFQTEAGQIALSATGITAAGNLDIALSLFDGFGNLLGRADPAGLTASLVRTVSAGTYYAAVEGTAPGDPTTSYDRYGSIGQFFLQADYVASHNQAPIADASRSGPVSGRVPLTVRFSSNGSFDPDGVISQYDWDFGTGAVSSAANPSYTFSADGTYVVSLAVVDDDGAIATDEIVVVATAPLPPVAAISASPSTRGTVPHAVSFSGTGSYDPDGAIVQYFWDFGDGTTASGSTASHTYTAAGSFSVRLSVTDNEGLSAEKTTTITVDVPAALEEMTIGNLVVSISGNSRKGFQATATVSVVDANGRSLAGATVTGAWSGPYVSSDTKVTSRKGQAQFKTPRLQDSGSLRFEVTGVTLDGYTFRAPTSETTAIVDLP